MRFAFIEAEKAHYPVPVLCDVLEVTTSGYYAWKSRPECRRSIDNRRLVVELKAAFAASDKRYGSPRLHRPLGIGRHRAARLMRENGIVARAKRRFCKTTDSTHSFDTPKNLLGRNFAVPEPNRIWAGDVTYIPTHEGWLFLAILLDLYSRRVVGFAMSARNDEALTLQALQMAIDQRQPEPGLIHHSDRGSTYASGTYQDVLATHDFIPSMSRKGNCWDNAVSESFFSTLEFECGHQRAFATRAIARREISNYILGFYNPTRLHSYVGYVSPMQFEQIAR